MTLSARYEVLKRTANVSDEEAQALETFLGEGEDETKFRMSPLDFVEATKNSAQPVGEDRAIEIFLHAAHAGLLELEWGVICPGCLAFLPSEGSLSALRHQWACAMCQAPAIANMDDSTEVAFSTSPEIRRLRFHSPATLNMERDGLRLFFSSRARYKDSPLHGLLAKAVLKTGLLHPGQDLTLDLSALPSPGRYVLLFPANHSAARVLLSASPYPDSPTSPTPASATIEIHNGACLPDLLTLTPQTPLHITSRLPNPQGFLLMRDPIAPSDPPIPHDTITPPMTMAPFLSAASLLTRQTFRDLFHAHSLPGGARLALRCTALLFTDLVGSTSLYERIGDFDAYTLIQAHFRALQQAVLMHAGAVVKTIGDAVMASFPSSAHALRAGFDMIRALRASHFQGLALRVGIHAGPCIAVESNDRLDFFGRSVNLTARLEHLANPNQIICSRDTFDSDNLASIFDPTSTRVTFEVAPLKGISSEVNVVRLSSI